MRSAATRAPWFLGALATLSSCVAQSYPTLSCPDRGGPPWTEALTPHVRLRTDLPAAEASKFAVEVERAVDELDQVVRAELGTEAPPPERLQLTVFRRRDDMAALNPTAGGVFYRFVRPWEPAPAIEMSARLDADSRRLLRHELTHWLLERYLPTVPPWLNEGLAELYSTVRRDGSQAVVGAWSADLYKSGYQPNVREVFAAHEPFSAEPGNYTESSALVHLLQSERRSYRARFLRFIGALRQGVRWDLAWREVFAGLDLDALEREINGYRFITLRVDTRRVPIQPSPAVTPTLRPMRDGEVHLVWLEVRRRVNAADRARAWRDLAEATKRSEDATELALWRAALTRDEGKQVEAVAILRAALAAVPDDRRLLYAVLTLVEDPAVGERLSHVARSSEELIMAARYDGSHPGDALPLAQRAVALSPASMNAWFELATVMKMLGRLDEARRAMQRAAWLRPSNGGLALEMRSLEASARASGLPALSPPFGVLASPLFESPRGMSFSGRVVTDGDRSFAGCVELSSGGDYVFARLDERGAFQARVLPGEVTLTVLPDAVELLADQFAHHVKPQLSSVDLGVHRVTLEPAPLTAYDGIETFSRDQKVIVSQVQEGSPADAAGVRRDDVLLSIDGRSVAGFGENGVNALLAGPAATEKTLVMQRGHEAPRTVRFQLAPRRATDGALQQ